MKRAWNRVARWLAVHAPDILASMRSGASEEEICAVEKQLGCTFPKAVRDWYGLHNGSETCALLGYWDFYSLEEMVDSWKVTKDIYDKGFFDEVKSDPVGPIRTEWWHPCWIPITGDACGNHLCIDLAPESGGHKGQVISWVNDDSIRRLIAPRFSAWFEQLADGLEVGDFRIDREGVLVRIGSPEDVAGAEST